MDDKLGLVDGLSVLIVEDEVFIAQSLKTSLMEEGARLVDTAGGLKQATSRIADKDYGLVILDIRLPDGEAHGLARALVDQSIPVVVHSGHVTSQRNKLLRGVVFCAKPASPAEFLQAIRTALAP